MQYAVLAGVAISIVLHVIHQSNRVTLKAQAYDDDGHLLESEPPAIVPRHELLILQPYGSLFFASAAVLEERLPTVGPGSGNSVVILRLRGREDLGSTVARVLVRYAESLSAVGSRLVLVSTNERIEEQLAVAGMLAVIGSQGLYRGDERAGATLHRAVVDSREWIARSSTEP